MASVQNLSVVERPAAVPVRGGTSAHYAPVWCSQQLHRLVAGRAPWRLQLWSSIACAATQEYSLHCCRIARSRRAALCVRATAATETAAAPTTASPAAPASSSAALTYTSFEGNSFRVQFAKTGEQGVGRLGRAHSPATPL